MGRLGLALLPSILPAIVSMSASLNDILKILGEGHIQDLPDFIEWANQETGLSENRHWTKLRVHLRHHR